ncbi:alpha-2-macroglobulin family protein [Gemmobacter nectariphilus]|uniref:alpha-2-macroglobulin family protein n=1 Tax=Gemmobacter nectariphilus TaxID=220343 RepID=UPI0003FACBF5|nr:alpha-2-macroglobulin family protein [Gemmobacter nectariphilus]
MRIRALSIAVLAFAALSAPLHAQSLLPERRSVLAEGFDLPGGDLRTILDTSLEACERACLSDRRCTAFTYNARNGSCFPKSQPGQAAPYARAISGTVIATAPQAQATAKARAEDLGFLPGWVKTRATDQAAALGRAHVAGAFDLAALRQAAVEAGSGGDPARAMRLWGAAANVSDIASDWEEYARLSLTAANADGNQARTLRETAVLAATNAYLRSGTAAQRHTILTVLAEALEANGMGRNAVGALRRAQEIQFRDDTETALDRVAGLYGLRIEEHEVQADLASPRLCATFTEDLVEKGLDYTPYVQLPEAGMTVEPGGWRQLCVAGMKHGQRVSVTFREGLPAADGQTLAKSVTITAYVRDRAPQVRFPGTGFVLPRGGAPALPVQTVNTPRLELELYRISDRNLIRTMQADWLARPMDAWDAERFSDSVGERIWQGRAEVPVEVNRDMTTRLPMAEALAGQPAGIYALKARVPGAEDYDNAPAWQWFVVSDLGLTTLSGTDGLTVVVRSLADAGAKAGVRVELIARSNRVLGTAVTDDQGVARFDAALSRGTGTAQPALVTVAEGDSDMAFLSLTDPEFDLSDRGVAGREPSPPIDLFLATDRGAYRAGETLFATALARDGQARALPGLPLTARLRRPDGVEYSRQRITDVAGGFAFAMPIAGNAPRGSWKLDVLADPDAPPLATASFVVEDFLPERIDFALSLPDGPVALGASYDLGIDARYLFGAPGAGLSGEGEVILREAKALDGFPGYRFGMADAPFRPERFVFADGVTTGDDGTGMLAATLPDLPNPGRPLEAVLQVRLAEGSGRPVERSLTRPVTPPAPLVGIKPGFDGVVPERGEARFDAIAVGADGMAATWRLDRIETRYQWYQMYGEWNWEPMTTRSRIAEAKVTLGRTPAAIASAVEWGEYELTVSAADGSAASSVRFSAGWYAPADTTRSPDTLELSLDKPAYAPGDTARLRIVPRAAGTALVSVLSNRVVALKAVAVTEGENLIDLPVTDDWGAGVYVTASVLRPMDAAAGRLPARAMGLAHAAIAPGDRKLTATLETPAEAAPRGPLEVALKVQGVKPGETAWATIAAVDVGILNLTATKAPDPEAHYFGQRKLGVGIRDLYGRLIDGLNGAEGIVRSGGDAAMPRLLAPPPTEDLVAFFDGPVEVGTDGYARAAFDLPSFNGTVRVMAVVWSDSGIGQAQSDVLVRDPVVVTASLPRFVQPGDASRLLLEIVHATGPAGRMGVDVTAAGATLGPVPSGVDLAQGGKAVVQIPVTADTEGLARIEVRLTTPDGKVLVKPLNLPVQAGDPETQRLTRLELAPGQSVTLDSALFADFRPGTARAMVSAGNLARFDAPGLLAALDAYPYGCTEQITSRALPLIYFDQVAQAMALPGAATARERIGQAISEVLLNQTSEGGFGLWSATSGGEMWLDAYVTDFLSRARAQGFEVPDRAFRAALDNLRTRVNYAGDFEQGGEDLAYALMVLAREGAAAIGDLRYYADVKAGDFATPLAVAQLGTALAYYGDQPRADALFRRAAEQSMNRKGREAEQVWRADFGSNLRDAAGVLALALETGSTAVNREDFATRIAASAGDRALSTQEQAWILLAANGMVGGLGGEGLTVDGTAVSGPLVRRFDGGAPMVIANTGAAPATLTIAAFGQPQGREDEGGNGYAIARSYYTLEGEEADPTRVKSGTRLVTVLEVTPLGSGEARLMVADPLPAGFEIDNPNLLRGGQIGALDWLETESDVAHSEFRQDRFLTAIDRRDDQPFRLAYIVRAVSPGTFHHPAASVEDMYRPTFRARTASGTVTVTE